MKRFNIKPSFIFIIVIMSFFLISAGKFQETIGNVERGAQLYYSWDWFLDYEEGISYNPLWVGNETSPIETWKCVNCHGWDYLGSEELDIPSLLHSMQMTNEEIFAWLDGTQNQAHDYSNYFTVTALRDISAFLNHGVSDYLEVFDYNLIIFPNVDRVFGEELYKAECADCHAVDGSKINFGSAESPVFIGDIAFENPKKLLHLVRFGHLEIEANTEAGLGWSFDDSLSLVGYSKLLPRGQGDGANLLESIDYSTQGQTNEITYLAILLVAIQIIGITFYKIRKNKKKNNV